MMVSMRAVRAAALAFGVALLPAVAHAESLRQALESAYRNNPTIMSALLSVKQTAEGIALAKSGKLPTIAGTISSGTSFSNVGHSDTFTTSDSWSAGLSYSQTIFDNFKTDAEIEQARALTDLSKYSLANSEQNVLLAVVQAYYGVIQDTQLVQLRQENMAFYDAQVSSSDDRLRLGEGTKIDVSQSKARQAQAVASYQSAIASLQSSQASFARYVGHKPKSLTGDFNFGKLLPSTLDAALSSALANHPAILSAQASIRVAQSSSDAAKAAYGPTLRLVGAVNAIGNNGADQSGVNGSVNFSLSVPIYAGGALGASIRQSNLGQIKSEVDALAAEDQIREAVTTSWASLQNASAQITSAQAAVESGQLVVEGTIQERDVGQKTTLDVLNAQAELTTAREGLIQARAAKNIAAFALIAATGRLNATRLGLNVEVKSADGYISKVEDVWAELKALDE
jgi:outer membrane protein